MTHPYELFTLIGMSSRLQVLVEAKEYTSFRKTAQALGLSLGEWVRQSLRQSAQMAAAKGSDQKLKAIRKAVAYQFDDLHDIDQILADIEKGYAS